MKFSFLNLLDSLYFVLLILILCGFAWANNKFMFFTFLNLMAIWVRITMRGA